jgi:hypothetical protein
VLVDRSARDPAATEAGVTDIRAWLLRRESLSSWNTDSGDECG